MGIVLGGWGLLCGLVYDGWRQLLVMRRLSSSGDGSCELGPPDTSAARNSRMRRTLRWTKHDRLNQDWITKFRFVFEFRVDLVDYGCTCNFSRK